VVEHYHKDTARKSEEIGRRLNATLQRAAQIKSELDTGIAAEVCGDG
jgi:hypothetical protein